MSRSAPGPPLFLTPALHRIRRMLDEADAPMTDEQIRDALVAEGFEWPTRDSNSHHRQDSPRVTLAKVRRATRRLYGWGITRDREAGGWVSTRR